MRVQQTGQESKSAKQGRLWRNVSSSDLQLRIDICRTNDLACDESCSGQARWENEGKEKRGVDGSHVQTYARAYQDGCWFQQPSR